MKFKKILSCLLALTIIFSALGNFYVSAEEPVKLPGVSTGETITYALGVYYLQWDDDPWWDEWEDEFVVHKYNDFEYIVTNYPDYTWERCEIVSRRIRRWQKRSLERRICICVNEEFTVK